MMLFLLMRLAGKVGGGWSAGGRRGGLQGLQLGFGEQGAEDLPVVLAERDGPVEVGGHALELAEVVQAQAVVEALLDLAGLRADHGLAAWRMACSAALSPRAAFSMAWAAGRSRPSMSWLSWR